MKVLGTSNPQYAVWFKRGIGNSHNGAHYYGKEIEELILPHIKSNAFIVTAGGTVQPNKVPDGCIFVCHHNVSPEKMYEQFLGKDILWVCSKPSTVEKMQAVGEKAVYIPLSIDTKYVEKFRTEKSRDTAFVGNFWKFKTKYIDSLPIDVHHVGGLPRARLLAEMAKYKRVIAEGRCNMEAQVLGCEVELPDWGVPAIDVIPREVLDSRDAIPYWRELLTEYDTMNS